MTTDKIEAPKTVSPENGDQGSNHYVEFEIGKDKVPWFLWVFFAIIISWASISWMKLFGY